MKIIVQNGSTNPVTRKDMKAIVASLPETMKREISSFCLCGVNQEPPHVKYYQKEQAIYLFASACAKEDAIRELIVSLSFLSESGEIPKTINTHKRQQYLEKYDQLVQKCINGVS